MAARLRRIGEVLDIVRPEFPDIKVSKIRYLESEGLLSPNRAEPSGYRRYSQRDIDRLRYVLRLQRDQYLPLRVIKENLEKLDRGEEIITSAQPPAPTKTRSKQSEKLKDGKGSLAKKRITMTRRQLLQLSEMPEDLLIEFERAKIIVSRPGTRQYGREALVLAIAAKKLAAYGFDIRHIKLIQKSAMIEAGLIDQASLYSSHKSKISAETLNQILALITHAHHALLQSFCNHS